MKKNPVKSIPFLCMTANPRQSLTGNKRTSGCFLNLATQYIHFWFTSGTRNRYTVKFRDISQETKANTSAERNRFAF